MCAASRPAGRLQTGLTGALLVNPKTKAHEMSETSITKVGGFAVVVLDAGRYMSLTRPVQVRGVTPSEIWVFGSPETPEERWIWDEIAPWFSRMPEGKLHRIPETPAAPSRALPEGCFNEGIRRVLDFALSRGWRVICQNDICDWREKVVLRRGQVEFSMKSEGSEAGRAALLEWLEKIKPELSKPKP